MCIKLVCPNGNFVNTAAGVAANIAADAPC
jgi:hypothetical protein